MASASPHLKFQRLLRSTFSNREECWKFATDGRRIYYCAADGVRAQDTRSGTLLPLLLKMPGKYPCTTINLSPDGNYLAGATGGNGSITAVWNLRSLQPVMTIASSADSPTFSPDGRILAVIQTLKNPPDLPRFGFYDTHFVISLLDTRTWHFKRQLTCKGVLAPTIAFSPDSRMLAGTANYCDAGWADLTVWRVNRINPVHYVTDVPVGTPCFLQNCRSVALGDSVYVPVKVIKHNRTVVRYSRRTPYRHFKHGTEWYAELVYICPRRFIVKVEGNSANDRNTLQLWDLKSQKCLASWHQPFTRWASYECSPDGKWVLVDDRVQNGTKLFRITP